MIENCKYKGGGLRKFEQGMPSFPNNSKVQMTKNRLGSDKNNKKALGPIKFVKECNLIKLSNDIDRDLWIDDTIPLEFDCFSTGDEILEYLGPHSKLPKYNEKRKFSYVLNEYAYFGQEVNFNEVFQVQPETNDTNDIQGLEELPSLLQKKNDELTFLTEELVNINIGTTDEKRLVQIGEALPTPQHERYKNKFIEHHKFFLGLIMICLVCIFHLLCIIYHLKEG